jgi:hypothetical protein
MNNGKTPHSVPLPSGEREPWDRGRGELRRKKEKEIKEMV